MVFPARSLRRPRSLSFTPLSAMGTARGFFGDPYSLLYRYLLPATREIMGFPCAGGLQIEFLIFSSSSDCEGPAEQGRYCRRTIPFISSIRVRGCIHKGQPVDISYIAPNILLFLAMLPPRSMSFLHGLFSLAARWSQSMSFSTNRVDHVSWWGTRTPGSAAAFWERNPFPAAFSGHGAPLCPLCPICATCLFA